MTGMTIAIFDNDRIRAAGLRHLLHLCDDTAQVVIAADPASLDCEPSLSFATPHALSRSASWFFPRRASTVIISSEPSADFACIDPAAPEDLIIERLMTLVTEASRPAQPTGTLSPRETDVLRLLATGHINKEIADRLSISINTVLTHRKNITAKLGIKSVSGLGIYAVMNGLISDRDI